MGLGKGLVRNQIGLRVDFESNGIKHSYINIKLSHDDLVMTLQLVGSIAVALSHSLLCAGTLLLDLCFLSCFHRLPKLAVQDCAFSCSCYFRFSFLSL